MLYEILKLSSLGQVCFSLSVMLLVQKMDLFVHNAILVESKIITDHVHASQD